MLQVGYLTELYKDARSEKYKILCYDIPFTSDFYNQIELKQVYVKQVA